MDIVWLNRQLQTKKGPSNVAIAVAATKYVARGSSGKFPRRSPSRGSNCAPSTKLALKQSSRRSCTRAHPLKCHGSIVDQVLLPLLAPYRRRNRLPLVGLKMPRAIEILDVILRRFFQLVNVRYETGALILTSNRTCGIRRKADTDSDGRRTATR